MRSEVDVVIVGAGMSGLTVGATVAEGGARVGVLEASDSIGGSAALSQGFVWTAPTLDAFRTQDPHGDARLFAALLAEVEPSWAWLEGMGVRIGSRVDRILGFGVGRQIDIDGYLSRCVDGIVGGGGFVECGTPVRGLRTHSDAVVGAELDGEQPRRLAATSVVLATGGFQGSSELRDSLLFSGAGDLMVRSNATSVGDGLRMALAAGSDTSPATSGFYGHLIPYPLPEFRPDDFVTMAQYHSEHGVLLDADGRRFVDEAHGDHISAQEVALRGRALLVIDERIRRLQASRSFIQGMEALDKMETAAQRGAHCASASTFKELAGHTAAWGYDPGAVIEGIEGFNALLSEPTTSGVPRSRHRHEIAEPPFGVVEVQAAITFPYQGLATDVDGRVLRAGEPIPGLFAAGVDVGGLNQRGYTGGLVRGFALGRRTGRAVLSEL